MDVGSMKTPQFDDRGYRLVHPAHATAVGGAAHDGLHSLPPPPNPLSFVLQANNETTWAED